MEIIHIKKTKQRENLYVEKLNVAAYARVSTKFEKQTFSLDSQIKYYSDFIKRNNNWFKSFKNELVTNPINDQKYIWNYIKELRYNEF